MVEVVIDSIRVSLISQHRIVMLRDVDGERQLPIWIGPCEAESITLELQDTEMARPLTHDLLKNVIEAQSGNVSHILINELRDQVFYARLFIDTDGKVIDIDCRPSDAIAVAVRAKVPIFIEEAVMEEVGILPEPDISDQAEEEAETEEAAEGEDVGSLDAFADFVDTLDFDDFEEDE
ncbi:MAG: bifunctional nuclease family protein [Ardenticatenaceae bacterium]|nr:bifunctional nuclease family protein [Ardenticatenaceae bacterium]